MKLGPKSRFFFSCLFLSVVCAGSASAGQNTAAKFEGTWKAPDNSRIYMGPVDVVTGIGRYAVLTAQGQKFEHTYQIESSDEVTNTVQILIYFSDNRMPSIHHEMTLQVDPTKCSRKIAASPLMPVALFRAQKEAVDTLEYMSKNEF